MNQATKSVQFSPNVEFVGTIDNTEMRYTGEDLASFTRNVVMDVARSFVVR
jgi:hypothetical protein